MARWDGVVGGFAGAGVECWVAKANIAVVKEQRSRPGEGDEVRRRGVGRKAADADWPMAGLNLRLSQDQGYIHKWLSGRGAAVADCQCVGQHSHRGRQR